MSEDAGEINIFDIEAQVPEACDVVEIAKQADRIFLEGDRFGWDDIRDILMRKGDSEQTARDRFLFQQEVLNSVEYRPYDLELALVEYTNLRGVSKRAAMIDFLYATPDMIRGNIIKYLLIFSSVLKLDEGTIVNVQFLDKVWQKIGVNNAQSITNLIRVKISDVTASNDGEVIYGELSDDNLIKKLLQEAGSDKPDLQNIQEIHNVLFFRIFQET
jgi:hypothetical protein